MISATWKLTLGAALLALSLAPGAAARSWQPEQVLPSGTYTFSSGDSNSRYFQLDASGNALLAMRNPGDGYRWAYRPHGGPLSAMQKFPADGVVGYNGQAQFTLDAAGNALSWTGGWYGSAFRPAGPGLSFGNALTLTGMTIYDVAMAPTGEAFGFLRRNSDGHGLIAFRPAGAASAFDTAGAADVAPNGGDTGITPLGVAIDADGGGAAAYKSNNSGAIMATTLEAGQTWASPAQLTGAPAGSGAIFDSASDGTAVVMFAKTTSIWASVRAPGGTFSAPVQVAVPAVGDEFGVGPHVVAVAGGKAVLAFDSRTPTCSGATADQGWKAYGFNGTSWSQIGGGPNVWPSSSGLDWLDASGSNVALLAHSSQDGDGQQCNNAIGGPLEADVAIGSAAALGSVSAIAADVALGAGFVAAGPSGDVLAGYQRNGTYDQALRAYEEPGETGGNGGGGNGDGDGNGGGGGNTSPITAPSKVSLRGTVTVSGGAAKLPMQCQATYECYLLVTLFKVNPKDGAIVSAKPKALAKVKATLAPGTKKSLKLKFPRSVLRALKKAKGHKGTFFIQTRTTAGGSTVKVTQKRVFRLK